MVKQIWFKGILRNGNDNSVHKNSQHVYRGGAVHSIVQLLAENVEETFIHSLRGHM
jgi:hypothetical protein